MTLADVKNYLKSQITCKNWYVGKIDASKECCIGIYPTEPPAPVVTVGGVKNHTYAHKAVAILVHWGKTATPAEVKAQEVYDLLFGQKPTIGSKETIKMDFRTSTPVGIGTDDRGIYEYVINLVIYYRKEKV